MGPPLTPLPLTPTLMSTDDNQSIHTIRHQDFHGIFDFMVKKAILVILAIFAILGVGEGPLYGARGLTGLNGGSI